MQDIRTGICPLCDHREIIKATPREFSRSHVLRLATAYDRGWTGVDKNGGHGYLQQFCCRSCGYSQFFAESPHTIPIDDEHETSMIRGPEKQLYR
jgi:hypothetical protein